MRLEFSDEPSAAIRQLRLVHLFFAAQVPLIIVAGILVGSTVENFEEEGVFGVASDGDWIVRLLLVLFLMQLVFVMFLASNERRQIDSLMRLEPARGDAAVARALTTAQLIRTVNGFIPSVYGLLLYFLTAELPDLLLPSALSVVFLWFTRPTRNRWERVFAAAATQYPTISPAPW